VGKIDDPIDASHAAWPQNENAGRKAAELAVNFAGLVFPPAKVVKILYDRFAGPSQVKRTNYLLDGLQLGLRRQEASIRTAQESLDEQRVALQKLQERIDKPEFEEAVAAACQEASQSTNDEAIARFTKILIGSLKPDPWEFRSEGPGALIRDVAKLSDLDIFVLGELGSLFKDSGGPNFNLINSYTDRMADWRNVIFNSKLHVEEFYTVCSRLTAFGFAAEVPHNPSRMELHERMFRPTHRGLKLLSYLRE
jgi:hypothetical protein